MLSSTDKQCISEIAELIPLSDLLSLGVTVTNNCVEINTKEDAIKALFLHECSLRTFLSRKKITRNVLFNYLHGKEINFHSSVDKSTLIDLAISHWENLNTETVAVSQTAPLGPTEADALGYQFAEWFYSRLNANANYSEGPDLAEEDFWNDCQTTVFVPVSQNESQCSQASSAKDTISLLKSVKSQYSLLFSPNLSPQGVRTVVETHGLVMVMVCGTLHTSCGNCVGLFEQVFGLIRNPMFMNNYKIKKMNLVLRSNASNEPKAVSN